MLVVKTLTGVKRAIDRSQKAGKTISFVPTMGGLHLGHLSLIRQARRESKFLVVSIFVNPIQFGRNEDFKTYPRDFRRDEKLLKAEGVDLVFYPGLRIMYPRNFSTYVSEFALSPFLCGRVRTNHFRGVATVVAKLFNIIQPDTAYFGQKDYQQAQIIKRMAKDLNFPVKIRILPIIREPDGLAMSSRNSYLNKKQRVDALCLSQALEAARVIIKQGERRSSVVIKKIKLIVRFKKSAKIDYIEICDSDDLRSLKMIKDKVLIALAVYIGKTRLIDNIVFKV